MKIPTHMEQMKATVDTMQHCGLPAPTTLLSELYHMNTEQLKCVALWIDKAYCIGHTNGERLGEARHVTAQQLAAGK